MKKVLALIIIFLLINGNQQVFAEGNAEGLNEVFSFSWSEQIATINGDEDNPSSSFICAYVNDEILYIPVLLLKNKLYVSTSILLQILPEDINIINKQDASNRTLQFSRKGNIVLAERYGNLVNNGVINSNVPYGMIVVVVSGTSDDFVPIREILEPLNFDVQYSESYGSKMVSVNMKVDKTKDEK
ncbi:hypothetical protein EHS13_25125 [Paenibacillus psychroresistens]|uniref:Copper amine oxidase-like N-terminal domain-containing protein n=1 Tax=Paenibacillus psychroresistens TaxID=1778678 RepID=A0A6B8RRC0_9BACL|nr:hypothetical protein [Paenibacillus psychroresistens]QGQ97936.1 hypothetical protein EHS13_25125 [Paenibacillus psychroresistens]